MNFKQYLITESREYLGHRVGDILTSVHELIAAGKQVGTRQLVKSVETIVIEIRKVLHNSWPRTEYKYLKKLQKCGVALMRAIDEKGDLREILNSVRNELESVSEKIGVPVNNLGRKKKEEPAEEKKMPQMPQGQEQPPEMPQQPPNG